MRILHVSDLHAKLPADVDQRRIVTALIADVASLDNQRPFDLIVFSGDLADDGSEEGLSIGREMLLDPLARTLRDCPIVLVPGNHDVDRRLISEILELGLQQKIRDPQSATETVGSPEFTDATRRLSAWRAFHTAFYDGTPGIKSVDPLAFVHRVDVDGVKVGIAALDTAWRSASDADRGRLVVTEPQWTVLLLSWPHATSS